jgi:peptide/nickel transport system permease protein
MTATTLIRRIAAAVVVVLLASLLVATMVHLVPGDAAVIAAGENATPEQVETVRERMGLDQPVYRQFADWLGGVVQGDFGVSSLSGRSVWESIAQALPATLSITIVATLIAIVVGVSLGGYAGMRRGRLSDRIASLLTTVGIAMPSFWVGMILVSFFALDKGWLPATGYAPLSDGVGEWLQHVILPATALGLAMTAEIARQTRSGVIGVMEQPYIRTARAKGAPSSGLIRRHVMRNAAIPVVTVLGLQIGRLLGGVIVVEQVFGINGLGTLAVNAVNRRDFPVLQAYVLLTTIIVVGLNLLVDLSYSWINPKVRKA